MSKLLYHVDTLEDFFSPLTILKVRLSYCLYLKVCQKLNTKKNLRKQWHIWRKASPDEEDTDSNNDV